MLHPQLAFSFVFPEELMFSLTIRPYQEADREAVLQAIFVLQEHEFSMSSTRCQPSLVLSVQCLREIQKTCAKNNGQILVGHQKQDVVGFVAYHYESTTFGCETTDSNHFAMVSQICVLPQFRCQNNGYQLLSAAEDAIRASGLTNRIRIWVLANNQEAIRIYQRFGMHCHEMVWDKILTSDTNC